MTTNIEKPRDVIGGIVVMAIGIGFFIVGRELEMGTAGRMGPGYFPTILSVLMLALGAVITFLAWRKPGTEADDSKLPWLGIVLVLVPVIVFGVALRGLGLAPAIFIVTLATAWASHYASLRASLLLALGLAAFCSLLFIRGLGMPLPLVGNWLSVDYWSPPPVTAPADPSAPAR